VFRAGVGLYYNDLAQNGWVDAFTAVNQPIIPCRIYDHANPACLPSGADGGQGFLIDPNYHTPYALQVSAAAEHDFAKNWRISATYEHQQGVHQYRRYELLDFHRLRFAQYLCSADTAPATTAWPFSSSIAFPIVSN
jgi:hypothetical protein